MPEPVYRRLLPRAERLGLIVRRPFVGRPLTRPACCARYPRWRWLAAQLEAPG